ncbi:MAG: hypothetical protein AAFQ29_07605 [Pseudomonadota bacterium]
MLCQTEEYASSVDKMEMCETTKVIVENWGIYDPLFARVIALTCNQTLTNDEDLKIIVAIIECFEKLEDKNRDPKKIYFKELEIIFSTHTHDLNINKCKFILVRRLLLEEIDNI